jgi:hypothetical protein
LTPTPQTPPTPAIAPAATPEEVAALKAQVADLTGKAAQADEFKRTAEFWHGKATAAAPAPAPKTGDAAEDEDEQDLLEIITSKGAKGLDQLLKKRGFVSAAEVSTMVNSKASQIHAEGELVKQFPELGDANSEFFKATAQAYGVLKQEGVPEARAMVLAAKQTALDFITAGKMKTPGQVAEETKATKEAARLARIAAQAGDRDNRRTAGEDDEADTELNDAQRRVALSMLVGAPGKDGKPMDEAAAIAAYQARAKNGVAMSSKR